MALSVITRDGTIEFLYDQKDCGFIGQMTDEAFDRLALLVETAINNAGYKIGDDNDPPFVTLDGAEMVMARVITRLGIESRSGGATSMTDRIGEASQSRTFNNKSSGGILTDEDIKFIEDIATGKVRSTIINYFDAY